VASGHEYRANRPNTRDALPGPIPAAETASNLARHAARSRRRGDRMRRREFITLFGGMAVTNLWPPAARAAAKRVRRIGVLVPLCEDDPELQAPISVECPMPRSWTPEEDRQLRALRATGAPSARFVRAKDAQLESAQSVPSARASGWRGFHPDADARSQRRVPTQRNYCGG